MERTKTRELNYQEIQICRKKLKELARAAKLHTTEIQYCEDALWKLYNISTTSGLQIFKSYSNEELLDIIIETMDKPGHTPDYDEIYVIYRHYIKMRFGSLENAKKLAKIRRKQLAEEMAWPADWPEHVCMEPLLKEIARRGRTVSEEDIQFLQVICETAKHTGQPPAVSDALRIRMEKISGNVKHLELMGIPYPNKISLKHLQKFWTEERQKAADAQNTEEGIT